MCSYCLFQVCSFYLWNISYFCSWPVTSVKPYIVQIIYINFSSTLSPLHFSQLPLTKKFWTFFIISFFIISQINPTRCTILFNIFIYFSSLYVSGVHAPIIRRILLYLCDTVICHSVWVASGLLVGFSPTSRPGATYTEWQVTVSHRYSNILLMMGAWMPKTCREEK